MKNKNPYSIVFGGIFFVLRLLLLFINESLSRWNSMRDIRVWYVFFSTNYSSHESKKKSHGGRFFIYVLFGSRYFFQKIIIY